MGHVVVLQRQRDLHQIVLTLRRRAASRACCTAGKSMATSTAMMAITTNSSISVNPRILTDSQGGLKVQVHFSTTSNSPRQLA